VILESITKHEKIAWMSREVTVLTEELSKSTKAAWNM